MAEERVEHLADLATIGNGVAGEKFSAELKAVLTNIRDPNTKATGKRKIVLEFTFEPDEDREVVLVGFVAGSTLRALMDVTGGLYEYRLGRAR